MTWEKFWSIIDRVRAQADMQDEASVNQFLYTELIKLPQDELLGFDCVWQSYRNKANFPKMVAAACIINDGSSDDRFTDFRNWLIMQGYDAYRQALIDPDNLAVLNIPFRDTEWMGCGNVAWYAYAGQMLSLPDDWDYTLKGLAAINKESVDAIRTAIWELEDAGYVVRTRVRDERGCLRGCDYYVYEYPQTLSSGSGGSAESVPPMLEPLASDSAVLENPMQLNKEIQNKEKQNTDLILSEGEAVRTKVRDNIELDLLCRNQPESAPVMQEIYELVVETIQLRSPVLRLGNNLFPMPLVRERLLQLTSEHIRFVLDGLRNLHTDVKNLKKYLLTMLFNAPVTLNGRTMLDVRKSVGGGFRPMLA